MCVIVVCQKGFYPSLEELKAMHVINSDGGGLAVWIKDKGLWWFKKGLTYQEIHYHIEKWIKPNNLCCVIHFRLATKGEVNSLMCHPFPIGVDNAQVGYAESLLFHNGSFCVWASKVAYGILDKDKNFIISDSYSDSYMLALYLRHTKDYKKLEELAKHGNKFVLCKEDKIKLYGEFENYEGYKVSNLFWLGRYWDYRDWEKWNYKDWEKWEKLERKKDKKKKKEWDLDL